LGRRDTQTAQGLWDQLEMFDLEHVCTDYYPAYERIVPKDMHVQSKSETAAIERLNSRIRHYLARFHRKTFCYSKPIHMAKLRSLYSSQQIGINIYEYLPMPKTLFDISYK